MIAFMDLNPYPGKWGYDMLNIKKPDIEELKKAFDDIIWMAIRYANNRQTAAPSMVRDACEIRAKFSDFKLKDDKTLYDWNGEGLKSDNLKDLIKTYR